MPTMPIDFERLVQEVYEAVLRPGGTAVDIGAHVGRHTLPLARCVGAGGQVVAVEPLPMCRQELRSLLERECPELLPAVMIAPVALSDRAGAAEMIVAAEHLAHSGLRVVPYPTPTEISTLPVELATLDALCENLDELHYVKLDAEGAELHILRGGAICLERFRPVVGFEFGTFSNRAFGVKPADMARFWSQHHYVLFAITGERLTEGEFVHRAEARDIWDYVAVPAEDEAMVARVGQVLNRPRVNWLAVRAQLQHAHDHAEIGAAMPPLRRFRGPLWPFAWGAAYVFLLAARLITIPQRLFNRALLLALDQLSADLEKAEREQQQLDQLVLELQQRLQGLERVRAQSSVESDA